jgi:ubiquinone/menaquinone biosynthesis C-methylase UbiE
VSAPLFRWLSGADFYATVHAEAVARAPAGRTWIDVGCGPGLVTSLAARRGFEAKGYDASEAMIAAARARAGTLASFEVASLDALVASGVTADVVSAASLLFVLPDPARAIGQLFRLVAPGGSLLLVETTPAMRPRAAWARMSGRRGAGLLLWGFARRGRSVALTIDAFAHDDLVRSTSHPLLGGLVGAWLLRRRG